MSEIPDRILVVAAHPDDIDFGANGTVARWTDAGAQVTYCVVTDGDSGGFDPDVPREDIPGIRRAEQEAAAEAVGVTDVRFLGYPDGRVTASLELRRDLVRVIREVRPDRLLCPTPERNWESVYASHPDHRAVGEAALDAVYPDARNPFAHPELLREEGLEAHRVPEVWLMGHQEANEHVDVTGVWDRKIAALQRHVSQMDDPDGGMPARLRDHLLRAGRRAGLPEGRLAESFFRIDTS